jgi:hypothetical protein
MEPDKRFYRVLKRHVKRQGNRHRRRQLKRSLADDPAEAHLVEPDFGRDTSVHLNGLDADATRRRTKRDES